MGLLDEAIRDHLELKRRSGADPGEIARVEHEALEPVFPGPPESLDAVAVAEPVGLEQHDALIDTAEGALSPEPSAPIEAHEQLAPYEGAHDPAAPPATRPAAEHSMLAQETVELDMQSVLDEDARLQAAAAVERQAGHEPEFEWEMPGRAQAEPAPEPIPGQERMSFE